MAASQLVVGVLALGASYALVALGFVLILNATGAVNFAQGDLVMAGGFAAYYYTYTAWDVIRTHDTPPGYAYFRNLQQFFAATRYWKMKPVEGAASDGFCLADAGHEYIVFLNAAAPFALTLDGLAKPLRAEWYQPFTGARATGRRAQPLGGAQPQKSNPQTSLWKKCRNKRRLQGDPAPPHSPASQNCAEGARI